MIALALRYWCVLAVAAILGGSYAFGRHNGAASVQADWDAQRIKTAEAATEYFNKLNDEAIKARAETETIRATFIDYKEGKERETNDLERAVADGSKRLRVKASCPHTGVPSTGTVSGGTATGAAELTADASTAYWDLRRGLDQQYGLLQFCRSELRKRSK